MPITKRPEPPPPNAVGELIAESVAYLSGRGLEEPRLEAEALLADLLDVERVVLHAHPERALDENRTREYRHRIQERGARKPAARIMGYRYFYDHKFIVSPWTLIPRPETEELVEGVLREDLPRGGLVLDLCCGTGCVGLSILAKRRDLQLHLSDISDGALETARQNGAIVCPDSADRMFYFKSDLFEALPSGPYQAMACNPPYIHPDEREGLEVEVREHDPEIALYHPDPPELYRKIMTDARSRLAPGGILYLELAPRWADEALARGGRLYSSAEIRRDLAGLKRYLHLKK